MESFEETVLELKLLLKKETEIGFEILVLLTAIEDRKEYRARGYSSLFTFCVEELKMSESQAYTRIVALREMKKNPDLQEKVESGQIKPTQIADAVKTFRKVEEQTGKPVNQEKRTEIFQKIVHQTRKETKETLDDTFKEYLPQTERLTLEIPTELKKQFDAFKAAASHQLKNQSNEEAFALLLEIAAKKVGLKESQVNSAGMNESQKIVVIEKKKNSKKLSTTFLKKSLNVKNSQSENATSSVQVKVQQFDAKVAVDEMKDKNHCESKGFPKNENPNTHSRYIPISIKRITRIRSQNQCEYVNPLTQKRCTEKHFLQFEHVTPFSEGGSSCNQENIEHLCGVHNRMKWELRDTGVNSQVFRAGSKNIQKESQSAHASTSFSTETENNEWMKWEAYAS